jgi:hypothetical protein
MSQEFDFSLSSVNSSVHGFVKKAQSLCCMAVIRRD